MALEEIVAPRAGVLLGSGPSMALMAIGTIALCVAILLMQPDSPGS